MDKLAKLTNFIDDMPNIGDDLIDDIDQTLAIIIAVLIVGLGLTTDGDIGVGLGIGISLDDIPCNGGGGSGGERAESEEGESGESERAHGKWLMSVG